MVNKESGRQFAANVIRAGIEGDAKRSEGDYVKNIADALVKGSVDLIREQQIEQNRRESEYLELMCIKRGRDLLAFEYRVTRTWWYRLFSKITPSIRELKNR